MNTETNNREPVDSLSDTSDSAEVERIRAMPKEVGVLLLTAGLGGLLLPGPIGSPFFVLGCVVLWPQAFSRLETQFEKRFPKMHHQGMKQIRRFLADLERRYPSSPSNSQS